MKKIKKLAMLLAGAMLFSSASTVPVMASETSSVVLYSEDFNAESMTNPKGYNTNTSNVVFSNSDGYGSWTMSASYRSGFQFSEGNRGITTGKVHIKFDFNTTGTSNWQGVTIGGGYETQKDRRSVTLLSVNLAHAANGNKANSLAVGGRKIATSTKGVLIKNNNGETVTADTSTWYTYDGILDLDSQSIEMTLKNRQTGEVVGSCNTGKMAYNSGEWEAWPVAAWPTATYSLDWFGVTASAMTETINIDNVEISADPIKEKLSYYSGDGTETSLAYDNTKKVAVNFALPMSAVATGAVELNGTAVEGELSADGMAYSFPVTFAADQGYSVKVNADKLTTTGGYVAEGTKTLSFTANEFRVNEDFETDIPVIYQYSNGLYNDVSTNTDYFKVETEDNNNIASFHQNCTDGNRIGFSIGDIMKNGAVKMDFKFRVTEGITSFVVAGNEYTDKSQHNWLGLLTSPKENTAGKRYIYAGTGHGGNLLKSDHVLKDANGNNAEITAGAWYNYEAIIDIDNQSMQVKVTDSSDNEVGAITLLYMDAHDSADSNQRFHNWPAKTDFAAFAVMQRTDIDDLTIAKTNGVIGIDKLTFTDSNGKVTDEADENTAYVNVNLTNPVKSIAVALDGSAVSGTLSEDGKTYAIPVKRLAAKREYALTISDIIVDGTEYIQGDTSIKFTPVDRFDGFAENFEGYTYKPYEISNGLWKDVSGQDKYFKVNADGENLVGAFHTENTLGNRIGFSIGDVMADGTVKMNFKFRVTEGISSFVIVGNEYTDKSQHNWLGLLASPKENTAGKRYIYAGTGHGGKLLKSDHILKNASGSNAEITAGEWYNYEAIIDIDNQSMQVKVTDSSDKEVGAITLLYMDAHDSTDSNQRFHNWPATTDFAAFAVMHRTDVDDITIAKTNDVIEGSDKVELVENFDAAAPDVYEYSNANTASITGREYLYQIQTENENNYGRFHVSVPDTDKNADYRRVGMYIKGSPKSGAVDVSFRFRPQALGTRSTVLLGNADDNTLHNWFSALNVTTTGNLLIGRGYGAETEENIADYMVKDPEGNLVCVTAGEWYTYNAVIDLDTHSIDLKIKNSENVVVGGIKLTDIASAASNYNLWPKETNFKSLVTLFATELDDISITNHDRIELKTENGKAEASVAIREMPAPTTKLIIAQYDTEGNLISTKLEDVTMAANKVYAKPTVKADIAPNVSKIKAMLWHLDSMSPLKASVEK